MKFTQRSAQLHAEKCDCGLDATYTIAIGWSIILDAPEDKGFVSSDASIDCSLPGNGAALKEVNWAAVIEAIDEIVGQGFFDIDQ